MKVKLASFKEKEEGTALVTFDVLDDNGNYLAEFDTRYEVEYNEDKDFANSYKLYMYYFDNTKEEIELDNIDWGYIVSEPYQALVAFDKKYDIA